LNVDEQNYRHHNSAMGLKTQGLGNKMYYRDLLPTFIAFMPFIFECRQA